MLSIGAALLGSCHVIGVDVDSDALLAAQSNIDNFDDLQVIALPSVSCASTSRLYMLLLLGMHGWLMAKFLISGEH